jgi:CDP-glucose 4,6-dehydratase
LRYGKTLGAKVTRLALEPETTPSPWDLLSLDIEDKRVDILDAKAFAGIVNSSSSEIIFHLAEQSIALFSYSNPLKTWSANVMGTTNVLEVCRHESSVRAIVVVATDKCYENQEKKLRYREDDRIGGHDPYSASKASMELVISSYRDAFFNKQGTPLLAGARAENVVGGGDWSEDRLIHELLRPNAQKETLQIRSPNTTRPRKHVLEP